MSNDDWQHADYLKYLIRTENLKKTLKAAEKVLKVHNFDSFAFRGLSGSLASIPLALKMRKNMICVRKPVAESAEPHSGNRVEGFAACLRYVIVDDQYDTGETIAAIVQGIEKFAPHAQCIGFLALDVWNKPIRRLAKPKVFRRDKNRGETTEEIQYAD